MSKSQGEPVAAATRDGRPTWFVWRGRRYAVLNVCHHWVISTQWWQHSRPDAGSPPEQEYWRVEASAGADDPVAIYELRHERRSGTWQLVLIWD